MTKNEQANIVNAKPTKDLFISMLTKDITLKDAIGDLVDNCIDGLHRMELSDFKNKYIKINISPSSFSISDNCGGIPLDIARTYAFRFGRSEDTPPVKNSIGQFGIGMKRALFKMGRLFNISSTSFRDKFILDIDVNKWEKEIDKWDFAFTETTELNIADLDFPEENRGTIINIKDLYEDVKETFRLDNFISDLINEIEMEHFINLSKGLVININNIQLKTKDLEIINSSHIKPGFWCFDFQDGLSVKSITGIADRNLEKGGWYIFCNDRMVLGPEQTIISGWGAKKPLKIPKYHIQFDRFRGYIFFNSEDSKLLPWNTSKNNLDIDSPAFQNIRLRMIDSMRIVINFLNKIHDEDQLKENSEKLLNEILEIESGHLEKILNILIHQEKFSEKFSFPLADFKKPKLVNISYMKTKEQVEKIKELLNLSSNKEVGERTFDYFYENECED